MAVVNVNVQMRSVDKDIEWLDPYEVLFEQYINTGLLNLNDETFGHDGSEDFAKYSQATQSSSDSHPRCNSPITDLDATQAESDEPWQNSLLCLEQTSASAAAPGRLPSFSSDSFNKAAFSKLEPSSLNRCNSSQINLLPETSSPSNLRIYSANHQNLGVKPGAKHIFEPASSVFIESSEKKNSAKMMRGSNYRPGFQDIWAQRMEATMDKYNLQIPSNSRPMSPPPSAKAPQMEKEDLYANAINGSNSGFDDMLSPLSNQFSNLSHLTPLTSPLADNSNNQRSSYFAYNGISQPQDTPNYIAQPISHLMTPPQTHQLRMSPWAHRRDSAREYDAISPDISAWPTDNMSQLQDNSAYEDARQASQAIKSFTDDQPYSHNTSAETPTDLASTGLLIDMNGLPGAGASGELHMVSGELEGPMSALSPGKLEMRPSCMHAHATTLPHSSSGLSASQSQLGHHQSSPDESSSPEPLQQLPHTLPGSARIRRQSHVPSTAHRRTKSTSAQSQTHMSASPSAPRSHHRHARTQSSTSPGSGVGFVNFTPHDSRKILTGVAPSGSSKTKARREREAAEKRRKLSEAAMRAVEDAGGDITVLEGRLLE
ncbi:MAG: hypothetical protein M1820_002523 [Bogoriella megaspora]|nr:MAG: hypothetical protein M1820_002523 [Bogoriella megaspora]